MQPRAGLVSAMSASRTTAWYHSAKFWARGIERAVCMGPPAARGARRAPPYHGAGAPGPTRAADFEGRVARRAQPGGAQARIRSGRPRALRWARVSLAATIAWA